MTSNRFSRAPLWIALILASVGCAGIRSMSGLEAIASEAKTAPMDQARLEKIFSDQVEAITGPTGALQTQIDGIPVYCISDPVHDRMRIIAPIARVQNLDSRVNEILLRANFHSTLDARYAISEGVVFAAFLHPISSLSADQIESALAQVVNLVKTFGTSFSSGELVFPGPRGRGREPEGEAEGPANSPL